MASRTEEFYVCDCCGKERIQPVRGAERGPVRYEAWISEDFSVAGGTVINWRDLCQDCHRELARVTSELRKFQAEAQRAVNEGRADG
jgi:hypothetical protein